MKLTTLTTILGLIFTLTGLAQSPAETTNIIAAQSNITKSHIESILMTIGKKGEYTKFSVRDYWAQADRFKSNVDQAMSVFQHDLEKEILPKAAFWIEQYNAVVASKDFSAQQKSMILSQRYQALVNQFESLSKVYQAKIETLYQVVPNSGTIPSGKFNKDSEVFNDKRSYDSKAEFTLSFGNSKILKTMFKLDHAAGTKYDSGINTFTVQNEQMKFTHISAFMDYETIRRAIFPDQQVKTIHYAKLADFIISCISSGLINCSHDPGYDEAAIYPIAKKLGDKIYSQFIFKSIRGSCQSMLCLSLRSSDFATLLASIDTLIDQNIEFKLVDGRSVNLTALNRDNSYLLAQLARTDFPVNLPFEN